MALRRMLWALSAAAAAMRVSVAAAKGAAAAAALPPTTTSSLFQVRNIHHRQPRYEEERHLLDILPTFSVSQEGVDVLFPLIELQLVGTSGYALSEEAYDTVQEATEMYLENMLENWEWQTAATTIAPDGEDEDASSVGQPVLTNVRAEVLTDRSLVGSISSENGLGGVRRQRRRLKQQVLGNKLELQITLSFQDSTMLHGGVATMPLEDAGVGISNRNDIQYDAAGAAAQDGEGEDDHNHAIQPSQEDLEEAFVEAFADVSDSFFWVYLWTLIKQGPATLEEELKELNRVDAVKVPGAAEEATAAPEEEQIEVANPPSEEVNEENAEAGDVAEEVPNIPREEEAEDAAKEVEDLPPTNNTILEFNDQEHAEQKSS